MARKLKVSPMIVPLPIIKTIAYYCAYLEQVELSHPNAEIRLLEVFYHKIYKVMDIFSSEYNLVGGR